MTGTPVIQTIHGSFTRHERNYCIISVEGHDNDYLFYSHTSRPLCSLMHGVDFPGQIPDLMDKDICIECGLGLSIKGGVALDNGDLIAWNMSVYEANRILSALKQMTGNEGKWIALF